MSFSFGVVNLSEFICLVSLGGALSVCRAWQWFSEHDWWVTANTVFLVLRTFPSVCGVQVLPDRKGKNPFSSSLCCKSPTSVCVSAVESLLLQFLSTSVFILIEQMRALIGAGSAGDVAGDVWPSEGVNQPELLLRLLDQSVSCGWAKSGGDGLLLILEGEQNWRRQMGNFLCIIPAE